MTRKVSDDYQTVAEAFGFRAPDGLRDALNRKERQRVANHEQLVAIGRLKARIAELEAAIKPFAALTKRREWASEMAVVYVTVGDLRRAAKVCGETNEAKED